MVGRRTGKTRPRAGRNGGVPKVASSARTDVPPPNGPGWRPDAPTTSAPKPLPQTAAQTSHEPFEQHRCGGDTQRGVQLIVAMLGVGVVLGVDTAGALPTGAGGGKARGMHEVKRATAHHVRTGENQRIGEQQFEEARLVRFSKSLFRAVRCRSSVSYSFCRLLELPAMAYRHPLAFAILRRSARSIPLFRADFLPFTSKIVEHSRYLPSVSRYEYHDTPGSQQRILFHSTRGLSGAI